MSSTPGPSLARVAPQRQQALVHRVPGALLSLLTYALALLPRWMRFRIMGGIMRR